MTLLSVQHPGPASLKYPPHDEPDLVDRLREVWVQYRRDNMIWAKTTLEGILDDYPWSKEASDLYAVIMSRVWHVYNPLALIGSQEYLALQYAATGRIPAINDGVPRYWHQKEAIGAWLQETDRVDVHILDIGANWGEMGNGWLSIPGVGRVTALDACLFACRGGHKAYPHEHLTHVCGWAETLPFIDNCADIVILSGILEHVLEPQLLLDEAHRVIKSGGLVVVQVPYGGADSVQNAPGLLASHNGHVHTIDPKWVLNGRKPYILQYIRYTNNPLYPHAFFGEAGEYVISYVYP